LLGWSSADFLLIPGGGAQVSWLNLRKALGLSDVENSIPSDLISYSIVDILVIIASV
jgi:hypothetical protein